MSPFCVQRGGKTKEISKPEDMIPYLGGGKSLDGEKSRWRKGYSSYELAHSWVNAGDIPAKVRSVLDTCHDYKGAELVQGLFEHSVDVPGKGRASQTDLLAVVKLANGDDAVIAVEGKAVEHFGPLVSVWNDYSLNRQYRLKSLCATLGLQVDGVDDIRYQLIHRTASAVYEARIRQLARAVMLVHSFSRIKASFNAFREFSYLMGIQVKDLNQVSEERICEGVRLRLAWVKDQPL